MADASCGAELQELVRHGGGHVDIVFDYSELLFTLLNQDIPIYEAACATEGGGSEMTAVSSTSEENKEGEGNFNPFQDYDDILEGRQRSRPDLPTADFITNFFSPIHLCLCMWLIA
uniref:Uncharacterized protein n=1 Tax=Chromera velia CCMP2878 TaxID=1169474 RepID=A0A0G4H9B8_9ALVE|eukprot:Cvel_25224.t1-p1 / transcript=Cvel_25224.t1 / gene=Cvel_25224 / organism=Chromera_velia_CCMP2878 / gene_product=hypothetical protein / transcript_product=hypothetical protein / location=Cvel_scaffold2828:15455-15799(+) / protein_length=115 / sequence_SO=supercontig / SO=protein_coding / is_pseudo=false